LSLVVHSVTTTVTIYTLSLHDALPISKFKASEDAKRFNGKVPVLIRTDNSRDLEMIPSDLSDFTLFGGLYRYVNLVYAPKLSLRSEEHTSELQSRENLVCRLLLEKKKK